MWPAGFACKLGLPRPVAPRLFELEMNNAAKLTDQALCSLPRRLLSMLYDCLVLLALLIVASAFALPFGPAEKTAFRDFWFTLWLFFVCFAYLAGCWRYGGMTVGMRAWRIRLVSANDNAVTWPRCLLRFLVACVSVGAFGAGVFWALVDSNNRTWHDLAAQTLLVRFAKR